MVLGAGMSKIEAPADLVFDGVPLPGSQSYMISHVLSIADRELERIFYYPGANPVPKGSIYPSDLITSQKLPLQIPPHWGLGFSVWIWQETISLGQQGSLEPVDRLGLNKVQQSTSRPPVFPHNSFMVFFPSNAMLETLRLKTVILDYIGTCLHCHAVERALSDHGICTQI